MSTDDVPARLVHGTFFKVLSLPQPAIDCLAQVGIVAVPRDRYTREEWYAAVACVSATLFPADPAPEQLRKLGSLIIEELVRAQRISPLLRAMRLLGPRRALQYGAKRASPIALRVEAASAHAVRIVTEPIQQVEFFIGLLTAAVGALGGTGAQVTCHARNDAVEFNVAWR